MGELVLSSQHMDKDNLAEPQTHSMELEAEDTPNQQGASAVLGLKWETFLSKMMLRVLLVEADDSTRQIIAALLRKCCYRVAAVSDGLKAWEFLNERPCTVDLILAEVELPSISGFALLSLVMEHEICKKIPVIMMSSRDSISTVYKCMMKGAADYLVKPLRRNELRNLWRHVWRRRASDTVGNGVQDESVQERVEVTSENETGSNRSTGYVAGVQSNNKNIEKGSDTQSSCTKVDFEVGSIYKRDTPENSQPRQGEAYLNDLKLQKDEPPVNLSQRLVVHENEVGGLVMGSNVTADLPITLSMGLEPNNDRMNPNIAREACDNKDLLVDPSRDVTAFYHGCTKYPDYNQRNYASTDAKNKFDSALHLDLSLTRCRANDFEDRGVEGRGTLRQSSASAFTRYTYRPLQTLQPSINDQQKEYESNRKQTMFDVGNTAASCTSDTINPTLNLQKSNTSLTLIISQSNHSEIAKSCCPERVIPHPDSATNSRFDNPCLGYGSLVSPNFCTQPSSLPSPNPTSVTQPEHVSAKSTFYPLNLDSHDLDQFFNRHHIVNNGTNQNIENMRQKLDSAENHGHISPGTDHSANSSLCGGNARHLQSVGYTSTGGSNSNADQVSISRVASESKNEEVLFSQGGESHRSSQREAALTKFRLKRKDRCFEKKVRYESRKKLAEQRPRVKGQFVRRMNTDALPAETNDSTFNR